MKKKLLAKIFSTFLTFIIVLAVALTVYAAMAANTKSILGYRLFVVITDSMSPVIEPGTLIVTKEIPAQALQPKMIITFISDDPGIRGRINTHAITRIEDGNIYTKGEASSTEDPTPVTYDRVIGRMIFQSPFLGAVITILSKPWYMLLLIVLPIFFIALGDIRSGIKIVIRSKKSKDEPIRQGESEDGSTTDTSGEAGEVEKQLAESTSDGIAGNDNSADVAAGDTDNSDGGAENHGV